MAIEVRFTTASNAVLTDQIFELRKTIFVDQRGWQIQVQGSRECDIYDRADTIYAAIFDSETLVGSFRGVRTDRPYLSADVFGHLAVLQAFPHQRDVWEISRFGLLESHARLASIAYAVMFTFAGRIGATSLVAVADLVYERYLRSIGIRTRRYGPPQIVGHDAHGCPLVVVAGEISLAAQSAIRLATLLSCLHNVEITDDAEIFGPARLQA